MYSLCNEDGLNDLLAIHPQFRLQLLLAIFTDLGWTRSALSLDVQRQTVLRYVSDGVAMSSWRVRQGEVVSCVAHATRTHLPCLLAKILDLGEVIYGLLLELLVRPAVNTRGYADSLGNLAEVRALRGGHGGRMGGDAGERIRGGSSERKVGFPTRFLTGMWVEIWSCMGRYGFEMIVLPRMLMLKEGKEERRRELGS